MKQHIKSIIFVLAAFMMSCSMHAQENSETNKWSAQLNTTHQDLLFEISYGQLGTVFPVGIRPQFSLDIQRSFVNKKDKKRILIGQVGFYNNLYHNKWYNLQLGYMKERTIYKGLYAAWGIEAGVAFVKDADPQYVYENEQWIVGQNFVPVHADVTFGPRLDIGYRLINNDNPIDILLTNDLTLRIDSEIGGLPYYATGLGIRYGF